MVFEMFGKEDGEKPPKNRCAKHVASYSKTLEALIASTKY